MKRYLRSGETFAERTDALEGKIRALVRERGVRRILRAQLARQYFRLLDKDSFLTDQLPDGAIGRQGYGYRDTPRPLAALVRGWSYVLYAVILAAAALGLAVDPPRGRSWRWALVGFLAYNLAAFLFLHVKSRYRLAFLPVLDMQAGAFAAWCARERAPFRSPSSAAWAASAAAAALALFLAFGGPLLD